MEMNAGLILSAIPNIIIDNIKILLEFSSSILAGLIAAIITHKLIMYRNNNEIKAAKACLARSFWAEITALFSLYENLKLQPWDEIDDSISFNMANIQYDYLSIFNGNADKIGMFDPDDAAEFVKFYMFAKYYIDSLRELSHRWKLQSARREKHLSNPHDTNLVKNYLEGRKDLFGLYNYCYEQQTEFYLHRDEVKKTFDKYL